MDTIRIFETSDEYLLEIPAREKERARKIEGRNWDPKRCCWVYPKREEILKELLREFKDNLSEENFQMFSGVSSSPAAPKHAPEKSNDAITTDKTTIDNLSADKNLSEIETIMQLYQAEVQKIEIFSKKNREMELISLEKDAIINDLLKENNSIQEQIRKSKIDSEKIIEMESQSLEKEKKINDLMEVNSSLEEVIRDLRITIGSQKLIMDSLVEPEEPELISESIKKIAIIFATPSKDFEKFIKKYPVVDLQFISDLHTLLEMKLKKILGLPISEKATLFNLIQNAKETGLITKDTAALAHFLRTERNRMVHDETFTAPQERDMYRYMLVAAFLWHDLKN